ncbi:MAG TPA: isoprenylcysteine carboxylmethyltransferase family protein [Terriglobales bacterium]|nr:isoprenylcysteine carboxylmethyltransferase family protein [Terriglobales bacterium]
MNFRATEFEFRFRFWFIAAIFWLGFSLYGVDHTNFSVALSQLILRSPDRNSPAFGHCITILFALGTLSVALGALLRSWGVAYLHSSVVFDPALHREQLVADGPFRYVRNPLYLGNLFLVLGVGLLASRLGFFVLLFGMLLFVYRLIFREEAALLQTQGESYARYLAAVPRLIPSLRPRLPSRGAKPNWLDGFTGESFMWGGAAALAVFTATHNIRFFWIVFGAGFAIYFFQQFLRRRSRPV